MLKKKAIRFYQETGKKLFLINKVSCGLFYLFFIFLSYKFFRVYTDAYVPRFTSFKSTAEKKTAVYIKNNSTYSDVILRLDHLYPAFIYYSQRKVIVYPHMENKEIVFQKIKNNEINWVAGKILDLKFAQEELDRRKIDYDRFEGEHDEIILKIK